MRFILLICLGSLFTLNVAAQKRIFWNDIEKNAVPTEIEAQRTLVPSHYRSVQFDYKALKTALSKAPMEVLGKKHSSGVTITVPFPDGSNIDYLMVESPNMEAGISARYPDIKSYAGYDETAPYRRIKMVVSPIGIHAACFGPEGQVYLDPYLMGEKEYVQSYFVRDDLGSDTNGLSLGCGTSSKKMIEDHVIPSTDLDETSLEKMGEQVVERIYRIAIAATGEWTSNLYNGSVDDGLAAMNVSVARINAIFEVDNSMRIVLIDKNDQLIHPTPGTDPYIMANSGGNLLGQNTDVINGIINIADYDYGHVYTASCSDVGGIAALGSVCGSNKGAGVTCHYSSDLDFVTVSIACHEMGHQFDANHTFNNCGDNIATGTAYEPGSGSTIMSYCGLCGIQNIQSRADDIYHASSLEEIYDFTHLIQGNNCPQKIPTDNTRPEVEFPYENDFYIPISTPLLIEAEGTDMDDDVLFYSFEQFNTGPVSNLGNPMGTAPMFRVLYPHEENFRYLPALQTVRNNNSDIREVLPTYSRNITFRVVVRDYNEIIGASNWDEVSFEATDEAGPFLVMSPNTTLDIEGGSTFEVTWDVANTDGELVNCQSVNILLSTDDGQTFPISLAENVPNNGSHNVVIPDILTTNGRVKIEAAENIFYDISNTNFNIVAPSAPSFNFSATPFFQQYCLPATNTVVVNTLSLLNYDSPINFEVEGLPAGAVANFNNPVIPGEPLTIEFDLTATDVTDLINIELVGITDLQDTVTQMLQLDIYSNNFSDLSLSSPLLNAQGVSEAPEFIWAPSINSDFYTIQIASSPSFAPETILQSASDLVDPFFQPTILLGKNIPIYWRVAPQNICGIGPWTGIHVFHTETLTCDRRAEESLNIVIPITETTVEHTVTFFDDGTINDFNISNINIGYSPVTYLELSLTSPDGEEVLLMKDLCGGTSLVNIGFDNEAPTEIPCPASDGLPHKPMGDLSVYNGKNVKGDWVFKLKTNGFAFDPGRLRGIELEVCSNVSQSGPVLINNNTLLVKTNDAQVIEPSHLLCEDANNTDGEILYTLVEGLNYGHLTIEGETLAIGQKFSQIKINQLSFTYHHDGIDATEDEFYFTVTDGQGGFIGKTKFTIDINANHPVLGVNDLELKSLTVFPNPANQSVTIDFPETIDEESRLVITDIQGRQLTKQKLIRGAKQTIINTSGLIPGVYFIQWVSDAGLIANEKLIVQH